MDSIHGRSGYYGIEVWLSFGTNSASPTPLLNDLKTATLFALPIPAVALILAFSRPPQASYFMAAGVTGVLLVVLLLFATADQHVSWGVIHFWLGVVGWIGIVLSGLALLKDRGRTD